MNDGIFKLLFLQELRLSDVSPGSAQSSIAVDNVAKKDTPMMTGKTSDSTSVEREEPQGTGATECKGHSPIRHQEKCHKEAQVINGDDFIFIICIQIF